MAVQTQRRPGEKAPVGQTAADLAKEARARADAERQAQEALREGAKLDHASAQHLAANLGNAALGAMVGGREGAALEEDEELGTEEAEADKQAEEAGREAALPSFGGGGGGGGGAGGPTMPPWEVGRVFGGDDDDDAEAWTGTRWVPPQPQADPDDDDPIDIDAIDDEDDDGPEPDSAVTAAREEAERTVGTLPWRGTPLGRGMRNTERCTRPDLQPEDLPAMADLPLGRLRSGLRAMVRLLPESDARSLAELALASFAATLVPRHGLAGATAHVAALAEAALDACGGEATPWARAFDVAVDTRARPLAEQAAGVRMQEGDLAAPRLFEQAWGRVEPTMPFVAADTPAAHACAEALAMAAGVQPFAELDSHAPGTPNTDEADAIDALLAKLTGAVEEPEPTGALREALDGLLSEVGRAQVELTAAGLAAANWVDAGPIAGTLEQAHLTLREAARRIVLAGDALVEGDARDVFLPMLTADAAQTARTMALEARAAALLAMGSGVAGADPSALATDERDALAPIRAAFSAGRTGEAERGLHALRPATTYAARAMASLRAAAAHARGELDTAEGHAAALLELGVDQEAPYAVVDAALRMARLAASHDEAREVLRVAGDWLRAAGGDANGANHSAPLQLLKAGWAEEGAHRSRRA